MSDDPTKELLKNDSFERRVLSELGAIRSELSTIRSDQIATRKDIAALGSRLDSLEGRLDSLEGRFDSLEGRLDSLEGRLTSLEDRVDARLRETRPIWEAVQQDIKRLDTKFDEVIRDIYDIRTNIRLHDKRLFELENIR